jgi:hypothetical protein
VRSGRLDPDGQVALTLRGIWDPDRERSVRECPKQPVDSVKVDKLVILIYKMIRGSVDDKRNNPRKEAGYGNYAESHDRAGA